ncbi:right-handed parallel beta-helix repeat-containing protein [Bifidobacterium simiarum]|uniref:right-handed parallel beta-helix repeat-containing protein n=1 Tax=Bifidobacterium simiarum TaxID=2045441 RepID=UPI001BDCA159|nr:right-handed parallel beta-helix repeat-containing protein [Bifidobacterium simiarum]MBT1166503.1 right-handed parallel beta-helix repeat-containing protein [Bifidobacterium simiarum]
MSTSQSFNHRELHVSADQTGVGDGSAGNPFATIQEAANIAVPGDRVIVHEGVYREQVNPVRGGLHNAIRIKYVAAEGENRPVIKGSEIVKGWTSEGNGVWHVEVPNTMFGEYNPYATPLWGDWLEQPKWTMSLGEVYLNGKALYEAPTVESVRDPKPRYTLPGPQWVHPVEDVPHPEDTVWQWHAQVNEETTEIWANFHDKDPNEQLVEINCRQSVFYPKNTGVNYITVRGFELAQAACPWAPPTGNQIGLIGAHWSKGWIIEDNDIHDARCSAVSLGKGYSPNDNAKTRLGEMPGYQYQLEGVFEARHNGWDKETVGSHIVRNNVIHDCGQNGVVGNLGGIFSVIENNHIYNIDAKREFFGQEIGGIKMHAAIDVQIRHNHIHDCQLGTWIDWQAQGLRMTGNVYHDNIRDLMIEVTHGPALIDNNIFASQHNIDNLAQGTAYVHNLFCGSSLLKAELNRSTPYHKPHSTQVKGTAIMYGGDDRLYQNIFVGGDFLMTDYSFRGTAGYDNGFTPSIEEFVRIVQASNLGDVPKFDAVRQPVYIDGNAYYKGAGSCKLEHDRYLSDVDPLVRIVKDDDGSYWLEGEFEEGMFDVPTKVIGTFDLGRPRIVGEPYENPDGTPLAVDHDLNGAERGEHPTPGPIESLKPGRNRVRLF